MLFELLYVKMLRIKKTFKILFIFRKLLDSETLFLEELL